MERVENLQPRGGLLAGQLEDLGDALADFLVRGLAAGRGQPDGGQLKLKLLRLTEHAGQLSVQVCGMTAEAGRVFVHLAPAIAAPLDVELFLSYLTYIGRT